MNTAFDVIDLTETWLNTGNMNDYYPYRAFGGQNKTVCSTRFVTRRAIISLLPGLCDKEGNNISIARAIICDLNSALFVNRQNGSRQSLTIVR